MAIRDWRRQAAAPLPGMEGPAVKDASGSIDTLRLLAEYLEHCRSLGRAQSTLRNYRWAMRRLAASCPQLPATAREVQRAVNAGDLAIQSRKDLYRDLKVFFQWVRSAHGIRNPMRQVVCPREYKRRLPRVFNPEEIDRIYQVINNDRDLALVSLVLDNGLRVGEVASLGRPNIFTNTIRVDYAGKVGERTVPVSLRVRDLLMRVGDGDHLWIGRRGPLTRGGLQQIYRAIFERAGITGRKLGPHTLRHTFGTWYIERGGSVRVLQEIMGHTDLETTMLYVHLAGSHVRADHAQYSPANDLPI